MVRFFILCRVPQCAHSTRLGDVLDILEQRHDWAQMVMTPELFKYVFMNLLPEVIVHSQSQDEEQVRDHYDRESCSCFVLIIFTHST